MPSIPLEIKALVVHELANEADYDEKNLSAVSFVWPDAIPYIREHRFKTVKICGSDSLARLLEVNTGAPAISFAIRSIHVSSTVGDTPLSKMSQYTNLMNLVMSAPNLEGLYMCKTSLYQIQRVLGATPPSSFPPIKLNTITIRDSYTHTLADLLEILCSFPHLTNLILYDIVFMDLRMIADYTWCLSSNPAKFRPEDCAMWDMRHFPAPKQVPQVTSLHIHLSSPSHLMLLDLLASPMTPFPNLEEIVFVDDDLPMCRPRRLPALLDRYKTTLRILDLQGVDSRNETPVLTLPSTVEHFKFALSSSTSLNKFSKTLSASALALKHVSINFQDSYYLNRLPNMVALDKVLVEMPGLEQLDLQVFTHLKKDIEEGFFRCLGEHAEGRLKVVWHVKEMKARWW